MDIVLIRHPAVDLEAGVCYGHSDVPLAESAEVTSNALAVKLASLQVPAPRVLITSPLTRCAALAAEIANDFGCVVSHDERLKEMDFGDWEAQRWDTIDRALLDDWAANFEHARAHGGELTLVSSTGAGTVFRLTLPAPAGRAAKLSRARVSSS